MRTEKTYIPYTCIALHSFRSRLIYNAVENGIRANIKKVSGFEKVLYFYYQN